MVVYVAIVKVVRPNSTPTINTRVVLGPDDVTEDEIKEYLADQIGPTLSSYYEAHVQLTPLIERTEMWDWDVDSAEKLYSEERPQFIIYSAHKIGPG